MNSLTLKNVKGYDNCQGLCRGAVNALDTICENFSKVHEVKFTLEGNELVSKNECIVKTDGIANKYLTQGHTQLYEVRVGIETQIESFTKELSRPLVQQASAGIINQEIRSHYKELTDSERGEQLRAAINSGDEKTAAAVLGAPPYLSGLNDSDQKNYTLMFHEKNNSETYGRLKTMTKVLEIVEHRQTLLQAEYDKAIGADTEKVNFLRSEKAKAEAAFSSVQ